MTINITRRAFTAGTAAMAAMSMSRLAMAQSREMSVATWGGDYGQLLRNTIDTPHFAPKNVTVLQVVGGPDTRKAKMLSERNSKGGSIDIGCFDDTDSFLLHSQQLLLGNLAELPRYNKLLSAFQTGYSVPHIHSPLAVIYNANAMKTPPKGFSDFWDSKNKGRVGVVDISYQYNFAMAAIAAGKGMSDYGPAQEKLRELQKLEPKIYPSVEALAAGLKSEEVWMAPMFLARGIMWQKAGIPVKSVIPEEGTISVAFHAVAAANSGKMDISKEYLQQLLRPEVQTAFSEKMGYNPTLTDAVLPEELKAILTLTEKQQEKLVSIDQKYVSQNLSSLVNFWNREFKR